MTLLVTYVLIALVFSFLCSVAEAVLLSVTSAYVAILENRDKPVGRLLRELKDDINKPLAAILTLNTIAHTIGAAGAGAQAAEVFGNAYVGIASAVLTLLILILSEIIPKTLGATHWRALAPITARGLRALIWLLYPFVKVSELITGDLVEGPRLSGFSRREFSAMADLSASEGQLGQQEAEMLQSLLGLRSTRVREALTPRTVVFSLPEKMPVAEWFERHADVAFSRIPLFVDEKDDVTGFVLRDDLLLAYARGDSAKPLRAFRRTMETIVDSLTLARAMREFRRVRAHIMVVVDEYGDFQGILTLEDVIETLLGLEIVDEGDKAEDMQDVARRLWKHRAKTRRVDAGDEGRET